MPSSHGRTHDAAYTRAPTSTTHSRHTPTGSYRSSWHRTGISMPASLAACQIVVPSGTVRPRPSIVRLTVRISVGAGVEMATVRLAPPVSVDQIGRVHITDRCLEPQVLGLGLGERTRGVEPAGLVVPGDHRVEPLAGEHGLATGGDLERLGQQPLRQAVVRARPSLARVERSLGEHDASRGGLELRTVDVPAGDAAEQARPLGERVLEDAAQELAEDERV